MTTAYTSLLGLALPVTGELSGTWGDTVNNSITSLLDSAIAGTQTLTADTTLTTTTGAANQSRQAILLCSPASANITITAPAQSKIYTVINTSATYTVKIVGVGPTTGVTLAVSESAVVAWNGSDFIRISSNSATTGNFTVNGNLTVTGTSALNGITTLGAALVGPVSATVFNTVSTTVNAFGAATTLNIGAATGTMTVANTTLAAKAITASTTLTVTGAGSIEGLTVGRGAGAVSTNTAVGASALAANTSGANNTAVGYQAGYTQTTATQNAFFGYQAGYGVTTGSKNVIIGAYQGSAAPISATGSNYIVLSDGDGNIQHSSYNGGTTALQGAVPNAGCGITFPATQSASSNANTLDDYEEGTWTPIFVAETGTLGSIAYQNVQGTYTKIGNLVYITGGFYNSAFAAGTGSGDLRISGLPFAPSSTGANVYSLAISDSRLWPVNNPTSACASGSLNAITLFYRLTANGIINNTQVSDASNGAATNLVYFSGCYRV